MILDTDVLIWYMRGNDQACELIESLLFCSRLKIIIQ